MKPWYLFSTDDLDLGTKKKKKKEKKKKKRSKHKEYACEIWKLYHLFFKSNGQYLSFFCRQTKRTNRQAKNHMYWGIKINVTTQENFGLLRIEGPWT